MALNDMLKHLPAVGNGFSNYEPVDEMNFMNLNDYKVLTAPPFSNVSKIS